MTVAFHDQQDFKMMTFGGIDSLFFFDNPIKLRRRRSRIPPESLPFQLRESRRSSSVKGKVLRSRSKGSEPLECLPEIPAVVAPEEERKQRICFDNQYDVHETDYVDLEQKIKLEKEVDAEELLQEEDDADEDIQKFLFEEAKFSAPNILSQLAKLFDRLLKVHELEKDLDNSYSKIEIRFSESIAKDRKVPSKIVIVLSNDLITKLSRTYEQLIKGTIYTKRMWQTTSYRYSTTSTTSDKEAPLVNQDSTDSAPLKSTMTITSSGEKRRSLESPIKKILQEERNKKFSVASENSDACPIVHKKASKDSTRSRDQESPFVVTFREDSRTSLGDALRRRTRIEKVKIYMKEKTEQSKRKIQSPTGRKDIMEGGESKGKDNPAPHFYPSTATAVINFSLSSPQCLERGWVILKTAEEDPERQTLLEWARGRLQSAIKRKEEHDELARKKNGDGPLKIHYYGDTKRDAAIKYKRGVAVAKKLTKTNDETHPRFLCILPDYGGQCYYPSGRIAVIRARKDEVKPGLYTIVYSDTPCPQMLACFTPTGKGTCYYKSGNLRMVCSEKMIAFHDEDGTIQKRWKWISGKLQTTAVIQLSHVVTFRCASLHNMSVHVKSQGELTKFDVSALATTKIETDEVPKKLPKKVRIRDERRARAKKEELARQETYEKMMEEREKELQEKFPERQNHEFDNPYYKELYRIRNRVKNLANDWLDHYRSITGMTSNVRSAFNRKNVLHSAASVPSKMPSSYVGGTTTRASSARSASQHRVPSAPPISRCDLSQFFNRKPSERPHSSVDHRSPAIGSRKVDKKIVRIELASPARPQFGIGDIEYDALPIHTTAPDTPPRPFRCGIPQKTRSVTLPKEGCPVSVRMGFLGRGNPQCRCDRRRIPDLTDLEFDTFVQQHLPKTQLLVVHIASSRQPKMEVFEDMLDNLYYDKNKSRTFPCVQSRNDPFRLVRYDVATACTEGDVPLLLKRHNAVPGMCLMYTGGKLIFADYIFNGYGNAKKDFLKQVTECRKEGLRGVCLPADFKFSPRPSRSGKRTPWGGEIGAPLKMSSSTCERLYLTITPSEVVDIRRINERSHPGPSTLDVINGLSPAACNKQ